MIPDPAVTQNLEFRILATGTSGLTFTSDPEQLTLVPARIPNIGFTEIASLPDGFLADRAADFDSDGLPEIAVMPYVEGEAFSPTEIFEYGSDGAFTSIHKTDEPLLPWNVGDVNHDGVPDLLGSSVARIDLLSGPGLPTTAVFDQSGVWGGEIADADGDGSNEILARSLIDHSIRIYWLRDDHPQTFGEVASLVDFSLGDGEMSSRFVVADLDQDYRQEILVGDADGDIWSYEFDSGAFVPSFQLDGSDETDARIVGGGQDLDGDGNVEFAVARAFPNESDAFNGWWDLEIYEMTGNREATLEWVQRISGVASPGNGISTGDLDGDGRAELAVALTPDLYVIRADGPNTYRPIYHTDISLTYRPIITDLDDDGSAELIYNADGAIRVLERNLPTDTTQRPEILKAVALGRDRISLAWMGTADAVTYRLLRSTNTGQVQVLTETPALSYIDIGVQEGDSLTYRVDAVFSDGATVTSSPITIGSRNPPTVTDIDRLDERRIAVLFDKPMGDLAADRDQESRRIVLAFSAPILDGVTHTLEIRSATDLFGTLVAPGFRSATFTPGIQSPVARADFDSDGTVGFSDFLLFAAAFGGTESTFDFDTDGLVGFSDFLVFASLFGQTV